MGYFGYLSGFIGTLGLFWALLCLGWVWCGVGWYLGFAFECGGLLGFGVAALVVVLLLRVVWTWCVAVRFVIMTLADSLGLLLFGLFVAFSVCWFCCRLELGLGGILLLG